MYTRLPGVNLAGFPAPSTLTNLSLGNQIATSLVGIARWQNLQRLILNQPLDMIEWEELTKLPQLIGLYLGDFCDLTQAVRLPDLEEFHIHTERSDLQLDLIPDLFPQLKRLSLSCRGWAPDITPLKNLNASLNLYVSDASSVIGLEHFPADRVTLSPRPRTQSSRLCPASATASASREQR
ncbi:hypothetical protein [Streptomyces sp. NPDC002889]|uniref:hypothetical protein n=1 Tax=Streptomyces sp. NPDC002889 TaxID=3364669 RepID=UPI0036A15C8B